MYQNSFLNIFIWTSPSQYATNWFFSFAKSLIFFLVVFGQTVAAPSLQLFRSEKLNVIFGTSFPSPPHSAPSLNKFSQLYLLHTS